ncbi:MAG: hypothetical protein ACM3YE_04495 [Bacteroidota bacterium]
MKSLLLLLLLVSGLLFLNVSNGSATTHGIKPDYQRDWSDLEKIKKNTPGLNLLKGEIIEINKIEIVMTSVTGNNEIYRLKLIPSTKFYCNGINSQWESLLPVAPGAYFEARVLVNGQMEALAVSAYYFGEECIVKRCYQNQGKLVVELISVISDENYIYPVSEAARLPREDNWKQEGQVVYILYNGLDEIRAVFLPD